MKDKHKKVLCLLFAIGSALLFAGCVPILFSPQTSMDSYVQEKYGDAKMVSRTRDDWTSVTYVYQSALGFTFEVRHILGGNAEMRGILSESTYTDYQEQLVAFYGKALEAIVALHMPQADTTVYKYGCVVHVKEYAQCADAAATLCAVQQFLQEKLSPHSGKAQIDFTVYFGEGSNGGGIYSLDRVHQQEIVQSELEIEYLYDAQHYKWAKNLPVTEEQIASHPVRQIEHYMFNQEEATAVKKALGIVPYSIEREQYEVDIALAYLGGFIQQYYPESGYSYDSGADTHTYRINGNNYELYLPYDYNGKLEGVPAFKRNGKALDISLYIKENRRYIGKDTDPRYLSVQDFATLCEMACSVDGKTGTLDLSYAGNQ
ncbi:MAG: hypothetical protein PHO10_01100 [Gemmiger sp.]|nr:hypothetical protein [Gemmiger sp.]